MAVRLALAPLHPELCVRAAYWPQCVRDPSDKPHDVVFLFVRSVYVFVWTGAKAESNCRNSVVKISPAGMTADGEGSVCSGLSIRSAGFISYKWSGRCLRKLSKRCRYLTGGTERTSWRPVEAQDTLSPIRYHVTMPPASARWCFGNFGLVQMKLLICVSPGKSEWSAALCIDCSFREVAWRN